MRFRTLPVFFGIIAILVMFSLPLQAQEETSGDEASGTFNEKEIAKAAGNFFGEVSEGLASVIEKAFADKGRPNAYIAGTEGSAAIGVGLRYGSGTLYHKLEGDSKIYWRGPSIGFDLGGDYSKVFILVYNLHDFRSMYKRFPSGEAGYYFVAGVGVSYKQRKDVILAPIRTGVGLRAGINAGWVKFSKKKSIVPF